MCVLIEGCGCPFVIKPENFFIEYEAEVSNSRIPDRSHAFPKRSRTSFYLFQKASANVIKSPKEKNCCDEIITANISPDYIEDKLFLKIKIGHRHLIYGAYDPLLGPRTFKIKIGEHALQDTLNLDWANKPFVNKKIKTSTPLKEWLDNSQFHSSPDSIYLCVNIPGYQYFRFDDMLIRYGVRLKITFWYLIAVESEGHCFARIMEYRDTPNTWARIDDSGFDEPLTLQGRWTKFEKIITLTNQTTTLALDFRIAQSEMGEMWIDDWEIEILDKD